MVYYGRLSQGCQRCRQRKVKCDGRKPECLRCGKANVSCPGFRDLTDVSFRDESQRIIRKCTSRPQATRPAHMALDSASRPQPGLSLMLLPSSVPTALSQPIAEHAACFFFNNYTRQPLTHSCFVWLQRTYLDVPLGHPLRLAVDSAGMAGLSKLFCAPDAAIRSGILHGQALASTTRALSDPAESVSDITLMIVLLLALYELVNPHSWENYHHSIAAHVRGAATLIRLRGPRQFDSEVGANLFMPFRSLLEDVSPPPVFQKMNRMFMASRMGQIHETMTPRPLSSLYFQLLDLQAAIRDGTVTDPEHIRRVTTDINDSLNTWVRNPDPSWHYSTVEVGNGDGAAAEEFFDGKKHIYSSLWVAQMWANWRALRIMVSQLLFRTEALHEGAATTNSKSPFLAIIRQMSSDICISSSGFRTTPQAMLVIWPLTVVQREPLNHPHVRYWALSELCRISSYTTQQPTYRKFPSILGTGLA